MIKNSAVPQLPGTSAPRGQVRANLYIWKNRGYHFAFYLCAICGCDLSENKKKDRARRQPECDPEGWSSEERNHSQKESAHIDFLYKENFKPLCCYLVAKFRVDLSDAEDAVHNAMLRYSKLSSPESVQNFRAFLYKVSSNIILDAKRHQVVRNKFAQSETLSVEESSTVIGPERIQESRQHLSILARILRGMALKRRKLLLMHRIDGLSYAEISRREGLAESTVREHVFNAIEECRLKMLDQSAPEDEQQ
ncbi:RNA polymerase sigma factor [Pseudomaricurvus alcaniphilus]|uniref:RNA polymerase sigma factor n=1 Tax=Pseudomaricurvus alcaniphilus TaxID=1166482 RepID=UPI0014087426|nr:RNA polymerase sigma factor [Pseudomaricurvus alcaniphilus]